MVGATASTDGVGGTVPAPLAGDQNKFLRGDATWVVVNEFTPTHAQELAQLRTDVNGILGDDAGLSMRQVAANEVAKIVNNAPGDLDTLKEIADWIADHPDSFTEINSRITILETGVGNLEDELAALQDADDDLQDQIDDLDMRLRWHKIDGSEEDEE